MKTFRCWAPDYGIREDSGRDVTVEDYDDAGDAAEAFHDWFNQDGDHTSSLEVHVRDGSSVSVFESEACYDVSYIAREKRR